MKRIKKLYFVEPQFLTILLRLPIIISAPPVPVLSSRLEYSPSQVAVMFKLLRYTVMVKVFFTHYIPI